MGVADVRSVSWVPMGRRIAAVQDPALCDPCVMKSRVGKHWSGEQNPRDTLFKGRNIQELSVGDTSVGDTSTSHRQEEEGDRRQKRRIL